MNRYRPVKYCGTWCIYDENIHKTIYSNTEKHMIELCAALNNKEQPANGSVAGGQGSTNTGSLQLLLDGFKKDYPNLTQKTIHAVNAFVLYVQQQQAGA